jgi:hypothetical protein
MTKIPLRLSNEDVMHIEKIDKVSHKKTAGLGTNQSGGERKREARSNPLTA